MAYPVENALFQWEEGESRLQGVPPGERRPLERGIEHVLTELRRRLGSTFTVDELAAYYGEGVDWAVTLAARAHPTADAAWLVDAAFARYAREAANFAGGRRRIP